MPAPVGILNMLAGVRVGSYRDEEGVILCDCKLTARARDGGEHHRSEVARSRRRSDFGVRIERDDGGNAIEAKRLAIARYSSQHDGKRSVRPGGDRKRHSGVDRQPDPVPRERDPWSDVHRRSMQRRAKPPRDLSQSKRVANVEDGLAQAILEVLQMLRVDAKSIDELRSRIVSHDTLGS
jgi:hypothetical protein